MSATQRLSHVGWARLLLAGSLAATFACHAQESNPNRPPTQEELDIAASKDAACEGAEKAVRVVGEAPGNSSSKHSS
jgi:hypothetical protein